MVMGGLTPGQLATLYGFSEGHITRIINSACFRAEVARLEEKMEALDIDVRRELKQMAIRCNELLDSQLQRTDLDRKEQRALCFGILDRAGYGKDGKEGSKAGRDINLTQINVGDLSDKELRDDVMNFVEGSWTEE